MERPDADALDRARHHAQAWLDGLGTRPVYAPASLDELRQSLGRPTPERGLPAAQVVDELARDAERGLHGSQGGRFFGWVIGGGLPAAIGADWLTAVWDQNACLHASGPAAAVVEEVAGAWLKDLFGLPAEASFAFVTGCQMAHVTGLAAARHAVLRDRGWDVERQGLSGAPPIRVLSNADRHASVDIALRILGIGTDALEPLAMDDNRQVTPEGLSAKLAERDAPTIVILQAGELNLAAFDPFAQLCPIARAAGAWTHVDGAFGLWARVSPAHRHLAQGIELADSWTTDGHKYLNVPYDSGLAFVRDADAHRAAMTMTTSYFPAGGGTARDPFDWNPELSRRARGFAVYAAIRELGREGLADLVRRTSRHARALAEGIGALPGAELVMVSDLNQALVRFGDDARTDAVIAQINASGEALFGGVSWRGRRCMRISVSNWRTGEADVARTIKAVGAVLAG
ncbi:aromatic-L-amino-acid decarboxylase [Caulobacter ginsengisoli]|uniref:Aromatic-L-amino-acid decarboxylase n=1 Tax=Caulobacter ginsengisoli TaxID=400775 RepID=A0ABU0IRC9_9CAUL|nr:pyridoxal-dependent decarboxylase [Caulobacter ginsengisoli]MDQ0464571.1 aromatic-L-amino-acid decarboxylase [Caulobacter ginsengisoli]